MVSLFCNNANSVLSTIQSRTQYISLNYDKNVEYEEELIEDVSNYFELLNNDPVIDINKKYIDKYKEINNMCKFLECLIIEIRKYIKQQNNFDII